ncbi:MAG: glycerol kinase GlpK [Sutterella sp.]|nr:glycerol kinase GlpK [Sutterella sp.]
MKYILALDQGTTSSRAVLLNHRAQVVSMEQMEFAQHYPQSGWVEHDALDIWRTQIACARAALRKAGVSADEVRAVGVTNQRETTIVWDRRTGEPVAPAIVWQDRRTAPFCLELQQKGLEVIVREKTGLRIDPYFSATKIRWILDHVPGARARAQRGELAFGTVDTWLIWNLTGGRVHATDISNASRTMLCSLITGQWDEELLDIFGIPASLLPEIVPSSGLIGMTDPDMFGRPVPISGVAGDQQAATFGQACFEPGCAKNTYGTGGFLLMNVGGEPRSSMHRLIGTAAWKLGEENTQYALEGSVFIAGAVVQWLRDGLQFFNSAEEIETLAASVPDNGGVYLVPAFVGLGAPHWDSEARGIMIGLTRGTTRAHVARAALEGIAFQCAEVLEAMQLDAKTTLRELRVDGGASRNNLLMQFQADISGVPVIRPAITETTALGAAFLAGLASGVWDSCDEISSLWRVDRVFEPAMSADQKDYLMNQWTRAVGRARNWNK